MKTDTRANSDCKISEPIPTTKTLLDKWTLVNRINGDPELQPTAKTVAIYLMWRMNCRFETCFPSRETIAADLNMALRTAHEAVKALKDRGWITWQRRHEQSSVYRFLWDRADDDAESYVSADQGATPQTANSAGSPESEVANNADCLPAKNDTLTTGKDLTRERSSRLSTASPTKDGEREAENPPSAEQDRSKGQGAAAAPLQEGSPEWWKDRVWNHTAERFRERFYPTTSKAAFKKRLGQVLRRERWEYPPVDRAMEAALRAEPALDAWEYVTGVLRRRAEAGPDYSKPAQTRGIM